MTLRQELIQTISFEAYVKLYNNKTQPTKDNIENAINGVVRDHNDRFYSSAEGMVINFNKYVDNTLDTVEKEKRFFRAIEREIKKRLKEKHAIDKHKEKMEKQGDKYLFEIAKEEFDVESFKDRRKKVDRVVVGYKDRYGNEYRKGFEFPVGTSTTEKHNQIPKQI